MANRFEKAQVQLVELEEKRAALVAQLEDAQEQAQAAQAAHRQAVGAAVLDGAPRGDAVATVATEATTAGQRVDELQAAIETLEDRIQAQAEAAAVAQYEDMVDRRNELAKESHDLAKRTVQAMRDFLELQRQLTVIQSEWHLQKRRVDSFAYDGELELPAVVHVVAPVQWGRVPRFNAAWLGHPSDMQRGITLLDAWLGNK